jgi:hypothetical protein
MEERCPALSLEMSPKPRMLERDALPYGIICPNHLVRGFEHVVADWQGSRHPAGGSPGAV